MKNTPTTKRRVLVAGGYVPKLLSALMDEWLRTNEDEVLEHYGWSLS